jgi:hypothetical protein
MDTARLYFQQSVQIELLKTGYHYVELAEEVLPGGDYRLRLFATSPENQLCVVRAYYSQEEEGPVLAIDRDGPDDYTLITPSDDYAWLGVWYLLLSYGRMEELRFFR